MHTSADGLCIENLTVRYGPVVAVNSVSLTVEPGRLLAVLGPNGAGKSSLLRGVSGLGEVSGSVRLSGAELCGAPSYSIARAGIAHVPEGRRVVVPLSVHENLLLAAEASLRSKRARIKSMIDEVYEIFPKLSERRRQISGLMSGGEQQMLAIARGLVARPAVLLLDEPSMGLAPIIVKDIYRLLSERPELMADTAVVLAEQSAALALGVADEIAVLVNGEIVERGSPESLGGIDRLAASYLGAVTGGAEAGVEDA